MSIGVIRAFYSSIIQVKNIAEEMTMQLKTI